MIADPLRRAVLMVTLLSAVALAGCTGGTDTANGDEPGGAEYASYAEAKAAASKDYEPERHQVGVDAHVRVLNPQDLEGVEKGVQPLWLLLYDPIADAPYTSSQIRIESTHPVMRHGTNQEQDPTHDEHGVYMGQFHPSMPGEWESELDVTLDDGTELLFLLEYTVS